MLHREIVALLVKARPGVSEKWLAVVEDDKGIRQKTCPTEQAAKQALAELKHA